MSQKPLLCMYSIDKDKKTNAYLHPLDQALQHVMGGGIVPRLQLAQRHLEAGRCWGVQCMPHHRERGLSVFCLKRASRPVNSRMCQSSSPQTKCYAVLSIHPSSPSFYVLRKTHLPTRRSPGPLTHPAPRPPAPARAAPWSGASPRGAWPPPPPACGVMMFGMSDDVSIVSCMPDSGDVWCVK